MSDHKERECQKCGSLLHHESDCTEEGMDDIALRELVATLRAELERVKGLVEQLECDPYNIKLRQLTTAIATERAANSSLREALEWFGGRGALGPTYHQALSTDAGKLFLDRLREAEGKGSELDAMKDLAEHRLEIIKNLRHRIDEMADFLKITPVYPLNDWFEQRDKLVYSPTDETKGGE